MSQSAARGATKLATKMGGGARAQGVHWHIDSKVWYLPLDDAPQEIGWVQVKETDGTTAEFVDPDMVNAPRAGCESI